MEVLTSNRIIVKDSYSAQLDNQLGIWVLHADKVPPHIGISNSGKFYSLKNNGKDVGLPVEHLVALIYQKTIPSLFVHLDYNIDLNLIEGTYNSYDRTIPGEVTCLNPLKDIFSLQSPGKLAELLQELEVKGLIHGYYGLHLPKDFDGLKDYSVADIHQRLTKLSKNG